MRKEVSVMWSNWLSNFYPSVVRMDGADYATVEHAYQAAKVPALERAPFVNARGAGAAKRLGRKAALPGWWEERKELIMLGLLRLKFAPGSELAKRLVQTGDVKLEEVNTWGDRYWGTVNGIGLNRLGELLMKVRGELNE